MIFNTTFVQAQSADDLFNNGKYKEAATAYESGASSDAQLFRKAAQSYTALRDWNKAITMYEQYRDRARGADKLEVNSIINILKAKDEDVFVDNIGDVVNSPYDEGAPRVSADGNKLYFFSDDRPGGNGGEDVWVSTQDAENQWQEPVNLSYPVNTESNEALEATNADGSLLVLFGNYDGSFGGGDLFFSSVIDDQWSVPCNMGGDLNSEYWEVDASITPDGKTMFFTSQEHRMTGREPDVEWYDIYITHLQNGVWTSPKPLPAPVNVKNGDERAPFISADGRTLYFSSKSHAGLGGYDLFLSKRIGDGWDEWTTPVNLGKEINTVLNDVFISVPAMGSTLYYSRQTTGEGDGYGGADIFKMILPAEMRPEPVVSIYGNITNQADSLIQATLQWSDFDTGEQLGYSTSSEGTGDYYITLPFGRRYLITANQKGYLFKTEMLDLREADEDKSIFSEKLGSELIRIENALNRISLSNNEYQNLLKSTSSDHHADFDNLAELGNNMDQAQRDLNESIRRARINWLEGNSGYKEVRKDISLTEANEGAKLVLRNIYFNTGSADLRPESEQELERLFEIMEQSRLVVEIGGHTDNVGSDDINLDLSRSRAQSVVEFIIEKGIDRDRISAKGYGEMEPIASNDTEEGRQENRRVEVKILSDDYGLEGTGGLVEQIEEEEPTSEDLYSLYRAAAREGGTPNGAPCSVDTNNNQFVSNSGGTTVTNNRNRQRRTSTYAAGDGDASIGNGGISFITHSGGGAHGFTTHSGMGISLVSGKARGERVINGYFLGGTYGLGMEWMRYKDLSNLTNVPLSFDYGFGFYTTLISSDLVNTASAGVPLSIRLRYNLELSGIQVAPYASYSYNALKPFDVGPTMDLGDEQFVVVTPNWTEIGARAKWSFLTTGMGLQFSDGNSGFMFRVGFGF
ncbi:MAG: OmpA family protein [Balneolales bacterium]